MAFLLTVGRWVGDGLGIDSPRLCLIHLTHRKSRLTSCTPSTDLASSEVDPDKCQDSYTRRQWDQKGNWFGWDLVWWWDVTIR